MKIHTYAFVKECANNAVLEGLEGTISFIGSRKAGEGDRGPWSFQTIAIANAQGEKLDVKLKDRPELPLSWKGKAVRICSTINSQNNRTGLYALTETNNDKTFLLAKATASAEIVDLATVQTGGVQQAVAQHQQQQAPQQHQQPAPQQQQRPAAQQSTAKAAQGDELANLKNMRIVIAKLAGIQSLCYDAAAHVAHGIAERHGIAVMPGAVGVMGDKLFMEALRRGPDLAFLPIDPYASFPFRGRPLDELIPMMRQQIGEGKAEMEFAATEKRHEIGRQHPSAYENAPQPPPPQPAPAAYQQEPQAPAQSEFPDDDDTVPF